MERRGETPVVIAGGGLVGLSTAMFLARHGVASVAVERLREGSLLPRAAHFHVRTLELFRAAGIEESVKERSAQEFLPEGAIVAMDSLAGRKLADIIPSINIGVDDTLSPCRRLFLTQPGLEPILRRQAHAGGAAILEGHEVVGVEQDDEDVSVTARDVDTGAEVMQRARYLVAADGAHSVVRDALGIPFEGRGTFSNSITIYFTADLWPQMGDKPLSVIYINNPAFGGFFRLSKDCQSGFLVVNTVGDPSVAATSDAAADTSEARLVELVRIGTGVPDLDVRIDGVARWRASTDVAGRYQDGRVFLAGDAAHVMPPNGGFGGNTGIADAYDVAWKLALAVKGVAGPGLLATYEQERRPVGRLTVEQAYARYVTRTATYLGATDHQPVLPDLEVELGYVYRSPAVSTGDGTDPTVGHLDPRTARSRPGTRAPHLWIDDGGRSMSTLDLMGRHFVLLTGAAGRVWRDAAPAVTEALPGVPLDVHQLGDGGWRVRDGSFTESHDVDEDGAVLVRPDGFVAWRAPQADPTGHAEALGNALRTALQTP
jgi:2-polyprenyl-6-methoxyphenol hydroxylase-like FAD-dependent oxidoreductase